MNPARDPLPDALRALALLGVLLVNALGYAAAPEGPLIGVADPPGSVWPFIVQGAVAWLWQGKSYPVMAFLFGYAMALAMRRPAAAQLPRRTRRLLLLGVAHGLLLYFGDILTLYAVCALWTLKWLRAPWSRLRRRLRRALVWALVVSTLSLSLALAFGRLAAEPVAAIGMAQLDGYAQFLSINGAAYTVSQIAGLFLFAPVLWLCMLAGAAAGRLRWLTHRRWQGAHRRIWRRWSAPLLLLNLAYAALLVATQGAGGIEPRSAWVESLSLWVGLPLAVVWISAFALLAAGPQPATFTRVLAPLGRHSLSSYIGHSMLCLVLFSGAGLGWQPGTVAMAAWALGLWLVLAWASRRWPAPWPAERWLAGTAGRS